MVVGLAENQSRVISNTIRILSWNATQRSSVPLRRFTAQSISRQDESSRSQLNGSDVNLTAESSTTGEVSRDMSSTAESSRSAVATAQSESKVQNSTSRDLSDEDRQYAEIFATLNEELPKHSTKPKTKHPPRPESIADRLVFDGYSTPSPRQRGVHSRLKRSSGSTPKEAETFNEILAGIFADLNNDALASSASKSNLLNNAGENRNGGVKKGFGIFDPYSTTRSGSTNISNGLGFGLNNKNNGYIKNRAQSLRRFIDKENDDSNNEEDLDFLEELELLKEEMEVISSDTELIEWAKNRVFKPLTVTTPSTSSLISSTSSSLGTTILEKSENITNSTTLPNTNITYPLTYPKILAHLLRTLRVNYNSPHLVLSLFHHAQTSSLESYLSGCLTEVYNEVLLVRWESFKDLNGVELGIREMEIMGVGWDQITSRLVSKIVEEISKDLLSSSSSSSSSSIFTSSTSTQDENKSGFSELVNITESNNSENEIYKKYGKNVLNRINRLDEKVKKDVLKQEKYYEQLKRRKRKLREERERKLEKELKNNGNGEDDNDGSIYNDPNGLEGQNGIGNGSGFIENPKLGERAFI